MLQIHELKKEYQQRLILSIPSCSLGEGHYWLKGVNGSGKSTLLKILGGLIPFEGSVSLFGVNLKKQTVEYRKLVSYAEAEPLYPTFLTGKDLISFFNQIRKADVEKTKQLVEAFNIGSLISNPIGTYSSGIVKKLSLVLGLIGETRLILLDEPLVTLDKETVPILFDLVYKYSALGTYFIFTSHQAFELPSINIQELEVKNQQLLRTT